MQALTATSIGYVSETRRRGLHEEVRRSSDEDIFLGSYVGLRVNGSLPPAGKNGVAVTTDSRMERKEFFHKKGATIVAWHIASCMQGSETW